MDTYKLKFTKLQLEILALLCTKTLEKLSQRDIAKLLKVSPTAISKSIKQLKPLIKIEKTKTIHFITLNTDNRQAIQLKRVINLNNIYNSKLLNYLEEQLPGGTIILFGSYSTGHDTTNSDIDLAVIGRKPKKLELEKYNKLLEREININFYDSFKDIHENLRDNILNGITLLGYVDL